MQKILLFILSAFVSLTSCANRNNNDSSAGASTSPVASIPTDPANIDTITFANGCFWCTEAIFQQVEGVISVESGYTGGYVKNPTYEEVSSGSTGHAECLNIVYDTSKVSYDELLEIFWQTHDPTTLNRQGMDVGTQYRSAIFYRNQRQKDIAMKYKEALDKSGAFPNPIVTGFEPMTKFYKAENYHQDYYNQNGSQPYCQNVIRPKLEKFKKVFKDKLKKN